jgi:hypothetical protein
MATKTVTVSQEPPSVQKIKAEREPIYYPPGTKRPKPPLPIWKIRETGGERRKTVRVIGSETRKTRSAQTAETVQLLDRRQVQRYQFRDYITSTSLQRKRAGMSMDRRERYLRYGERGALRAGGAVGSNPFVAGMLRVGAIMLLLVILFLVLSHADATGNAVQKFGAFMTNLTSPQPFFKKTTTNAA